ncbi:hypothetical protein BDQ17DRAFT_1358227 [Cyathus striatus]|nr:hypothetical protein BDQ17DRAFT_1358227 [Cyathus striatus]
MPGGTATNQLNNYLQERQMSSYISWSEKSAGTAQNPTWTVECKISGVVMGTGTAARKQAAKEIAARQALQRLMSSQ